MCVGGVHLVWLVMCITPSSTPVSRLSSGLEFAVDCTTWNYADTFVPVVRLQMFAVNFPARLMGDV